jgi:hypothetical protein
MSTIVIVMLVYHCYKSTEFIGVLVGLSVKITVMQDVEPSSTVH